MFKLFFLFVNIQTSDVRDCVNFLFWYGSSSTKAQLEDFFRILWSGLNPAEGLNKSPLHKSAPDTQTLRPPVNAHCYITTTFFYPELE